jgi:GcrA cell cycle regulator
MGFILTPWTDERVERLRVLVEARYSCSQIAADLGGTTRNAVIGKMNRLSLQSPNPANGGAKGMKAVRQYKPKKHQNIYATRWGASDPDAKPPMDMEAIKVADVIPLHLSFAKIERDQCRYPYGSDTEITYCGNHTAGATYCDQHYRLCYNPATNRTGTARPGMKYVNLHREPKILVLAEELA